MEQGDGCQPQNYRRNSTTPPILRRVTPLFAERQRSVPRLGDIWVPKLASSPNHFVRLYIPGVEDLFQVGDWLLRVEHNGSRSRLISWRIWRNQEGAWQFQQESTDEQSFSIFPSNFSPLRLVAEGVQSEFAEWLGERCSS
jgi:hypothetical protein